MKINSIIPCNSYTCQVCSLDFFVRPNEEFIINPGISPLCSKRCVFRLYYKFFSEYSKKQLIDLSIVLKIEKINGLSPLSPNLDRNVLIFTVTKKYPKLSFSSINNLGTKGQGQKNRDKNGLKGQRDRDNNPLCNKGLSLFVPSPNFSNAPKSKGGLSKWF